MDHTVLQMKRHLKVTQRGQHKPGQTSQERKAACLSLSCAGSSHFHLTKNPTVTHRSVAGVFRGSRRYIIVPFYLRFLPEPEIFWEINTSSLSSMWVTPYRCLKSSKTQRVAKSVAYLFYCGNRPQIRLWGETRSKVDLPKESDLQRCVWDRLLSLNFAQQRASGS